MNEPNHPQRGANQPAVTPWSAGQTLVFALAIAALLPLVNMVVAMLMAGFSAAADSNFDQQLFYQHLRHNGGYLIFASIAANCATIWAVLKFIRLRGAVGPVTYLALRLPDKPAWIITLVGVVLFLLFSELVGAGLGRPRYPDFLLQIYATAQPLALFWVAVLLLAPLAEEVYFRGFVYIGLRNSMLGASGAILVTAAIWALIHLQYDVYDKTEIFLLGLFMGWLRYRYNSLLPPLVAHGLINLVALVGLANSGVG